MWYYARDGKPVGPFDKVELLERARRGDFGPDDYVWHPDFGSEWRLAQDVEGIFEFPGMGRLVGGTGGATPNRELMRQARETLRGNWPAAVGATLVLYGLIFVLMAGQTAAEQLGAWWAGLIPVILVPILSVGYYRFHRRLIYEGKADLSELFKGFQSWIAAFVANVLTQIFVFLWIVLFSVPLILLAVLLGYRLPTSGGKSSDIPAVLVLGLVVLVIAAVWASFRYFMTLPAIADEPTIGPMEAIRRSVRLIRGHYWKLFCFNLRYLGWLLLAILPCGLGLLWFIPYFCSGVMHFYRDLKPPAD